jgi:hypothetical protein
VLSKLPMETPYAGLTIEEKLRQLAQVILYNIEERKGPNESQMEYMKSEPEMELKYNKMKVIDGEMAADEWLINQFSNLPNVAP